MLVIPADSTPGRLETPLRNIAVKPDDLLVALIGRVRSHHLQRRDVVRIEAQRHV